MYKDQNSKKRSEIFVTYYIYFEQTKRREKSFLTGFENDFPVSSESEHYEELKEEWYWESVLSNDFYGVKSNTLANMVAALGLGSEELRGAA